MRNAATEVEFVRLSQPVRSHADQERRWRGAALTVQDCDRVVRSNCDVFKPNGEVLLHFRRGVIPSDLCARAYGHLRELQGDLSNRGLAAVGFTAKARRPDGTLSNQTRLRMSQYPSLRDVGSAVIGYMDRGPLGRYPYCRQTAFNLESPEKFADCMDYIRAIDSVFKAVAPTRHAAQMAMIRKTHPKFVIHGTAFTTITVNRNFRTYTHQDAGDYKQGFGVMSVMQGGEYQGGYTVFPEYRVAADMRTGDVLLADVHEWHGNTPILGRPGEYERISCVFYYRERMVECGSPAEELDRARNIGLGADVVTR